MAMVTNVRDARGVLQEYRHQFLEDVDVAVEHLRRSASHLEEVLAGTVLLTDDLDELVEEGRVTLDMYGGLIGMLVREARNMAGVSTV